MTWVLANIDQIGLYTLAHLLQALPAIVLAFLIAVPLARIVGPRRWLRSPVTTTAGLLYAIPSLPLFVLMPGIIGTSVRSPVNIVIALSLYGIALMVPAAVDAFASVDRDTVGAATAQGYSRGTLFWAVELPLAGPVLLAALRVVAVSTISLVTVGGVLGVPSLGMLFVDGFQRGIVAEIAAGLVATIVLALLVDRGLYLLGRLAMPWTTVERSRA